MTVQSTSVHVSVHVIVAAVPWSISSLFGCSVYLLRYSCSGVARLGRLTGQTRTYLLLYFTVLLEVATFSTPVADLGGPTRPALSYATVQLHHSMG